MSDKTNTDTLLIVNAINRQTEILQKTLERLESVSNENKKILDDINCERCIHSSFEYNGISIKMKTILTIILMSQVVILMSIEGVDVSFVKSILLSLL